MPHAAYPTSSDLETFLLSTGFTQAQVDELDLATMAAAGADLFKLMTGRRMLAATQTREYRPRDVKVNGVLPLKADLLSVSSLTYGTTSYVAGTDYLLGPLNALDDGKPYNRIEFLRWPGCHSGWPTPTLISITGSWGYGATIPDAAFTAMLTLGALSRFANILGLRTGHMVAWKEADMDEQFGTKPLQGLMDAWSQVSGVIGVYRKVTAG